MTVEGLTWWTDGMRNLRLLCDEHGGEARARGEAHGQVYAGRRAAMVFDVVASRQRKYTQRVEPMVKKFAATPGAKTAPRPARKWITLADAAERLSVSPRTIRRFISEAPGRFIRTRRDPDHVMRRITKQANVLGFTVRFDPIPETAATT